MGATHPMMRIAVMLSFLVLIGPLSGCFGDEELVEEEVEQPFYPDIHERQFLQWDWNGSYAMVLEQGPYLPLPVQEAMIEVDTSDIWETGPPTSNVHLSEARTAGS